MYYTIELVGGPRDGEVHALPDDMMVYRLYAPDTSMPKWSGEDGPVETSAIESLQLQYLRSQSMNDRGERIYRYVPPKVP